MSSILTAGLTNGTELMAPTTTEDSQTATIAPPP